MHPRSEMVGRPAARQESQGPSIRSRNETWGYGAKSLDAHAFICDQMICSGVNCQLLTAQFP
jgi:hypothetical protein